ncbi:putative serine/threonine-protein kinase PBL7 [Iris pallida]|uniref:Serine/threonine-protein kinase PBL7 n=1 Tax=Iris pallida TaxID=29817 RepID=A0AAX6FKR7_IRIPA|nr:putative serine/threonine-protein kinase PBL7 [Iris pallida]
MACCVWIPHQQHRHQKTMPWGLSSVLSLLRRRRRRKEDLIGNNSNKSWLLAAEEGERHEEEEEEEEMVSHSVHSSFRFSFGSQGDAEEAGLRPPAAVLLLVNLEDGAEEEEEEVKMEGRKWTKLQSLERSISPVSGSLVRFSYSQIRAATQDFCRGRELGRGAHSRVYKGKIGAGRRSAVAIKRVEGQDRESAKAFCRELLIASSLHNPNIVPLLGFCVDQEGLFLVYKYVSGGSLDSHLHPHGSRKKVLSWRARYKIALGVAHAIGYLHYGTDKCVVHRDIKPSNILLSSNKTPQLCDFGLATWTHGPSLPFLCKAVKGTFGYLSPEYFQHGKLSDKTDVYAFGVVLLELITGRKVIDQSRPQGDENLVLWAKPLLQQGEGAMEKLIDPMLKVTSWHEMSRMVRAASACVKNDECARPSIDQVIGMLEGEEFSCSTDWLTFSGNNSCLLSPYASQSHDQAPERGDMKGHLALAMLGVSDSDEEDSYGR